MTKLLEKTGGAPLLRWTYEGEEREYDFRPDMTLTLDDHREALDLARAHGSVRIVEHNLHEDEDDEDDEDEASWETREGPPTMTEARDTYRAAQALAKHLDLPASGDHETLVERIENEPVEVPEE